MQLPPIMPPVRYPAFFLDTTSEAPPIFWSGPEPVSYALPVPKPVMPTVDRLDLAQQKAKQYKEKGNEYRKFQHYKLAIEQYQRSIEENPRYTDAYYNLGTTYAITGDYENALKTFRALLAINPNDHDARVTMAGYMQQLGQLKETIPQYEYVLGQSPHFDPASRNLAKVQHLLLKKEDADQADRLLKVTGELNLAAAKKWIQAFYTPQQQNEVLQYLDKVKFEFKETQKVNQIQNLAEYDYDKQVIRLTPELLFAHPNVIAAYIIHELQHAKDNDGISSIAEEQDGYLELAKFWQQNKYGVEEPNLDLSARLLAESPMALMNKVEDSYRGRDALMPDTSPGHGQPPGAIDLNLLALDRSVQLARFNEGRIKSLLSLVGQKFN